MSTAPRPTPEIADLDAQAAWLEARQVAITLNRYAQSLREVADQIDAAAARLADPATLDQLGTHDLTPAASLAAEAMRAVDTVAWNHRPPGIVTQAARIDTYRAAAAARAERPDTKENPA